MKRTHRTPEQWAKLFATFENSGTSQSNFAKTVGVNPAYFSIKYRASRASQDTPNTAPFIRATQKTPQATSQDFWVRYRNTELGLPMSVKPEWLASFVKALAE
ncbi:Hypothetical protein HDN1F_32520 [gamma proteobacterium HdN1]|nr:Hypothetical protein HDN1F_19400 [gamma proteobacterium HdN1]CBL45600.1 Hypothetical protein HDN1F_20170 [gamma proteobacterium HdN1]CBL46555.1 hypothetical protein HDN1F_29720 [gamma proteobacterium HdN1]CBL46835.1 Hypothetical protein HDN1F_32520 [gamma proteobacterium HdN1]